MILAPMPYLICRQLKYLFNIIICLTLFQSCRPVADQESTDFPGKPKVPEVLLAEHRLLLSAIDSLALLKDSTGVVALKLKEIMEHHFKEEEDYVFPALGTLALLAGDHIPAESDRIIQLTEKLEKQHNHMIAEHQLVKAFLEDLLRVSNSEKHQGLETFKKAVLTHAAGEELIYFPAAILVGKYLKAKTK